MTITPRVTLFYANGSKGKLEMYNRPPEITVEHVHHGRVVDTVKFERNGPDCYREVINTVESKHNEPNATVRE